MLLLQKMCYTTQKERKMKVAIIKYNAGNIFSVDYALRRLGVEPVITADAEELTGADKVIFPGVGEAATTMDYLRRTGLDQLIKDLKQPVLGICLGIFQADVKRFHPQQHEDKVPHMGWNTLTETRGDLFKGFDKEEFVYFVHSFYVPVNECTAAQTQYIHPFSAAIQKDNFYATQFHPEKSGKIGERILTNFLNL